MNEADMTQIPLWIVASLGKQVALTTDFIGPCETYRAGCRGKLLAVMVDEMNYDGEPYALVGLDANDLSYMENFRFDDLMPITNRVKFSLNIEQGIIAF